MATVTEILRGAYGKSLKNKAGAIASESIELVQVVQRAQDGLFAFAARINPEYFGKSATVSFAAGGWAYPSDGECVFRIENAGGTEVVVVPLDHRTAEPTKPAVYFLGRKFLSAGNSSDPTSGDLTLFYARRGATLASPSSNIDPDFPAAYNELLILETAIYLAVKDSGSGRMEEVAHLKAERDVWALRLVAHLEHAVAGILRRHNSVYASPTLVPAASLLAGGSSINV